MNDFNSIFADNFNYYMQRNNLSQKEIAEKLGISTSAVSTWAQGLNTPRMDKVAKLTEIFDCKNSDLLERHIKAVEVPVSNSQEFSSVIVFKPGTMDGKTLEAVKNFIKQMGGEIV